MAEESGREQAQVGVRSSSSLGPTPQIGSQLRREGELRLARVEPSASASGRDSPPLESQAVHLRTSHPTSAPKIQRSSTPYSVPAKLHHSLAHLLLIITNDLPPPQIRQVLFLFFLLLLDWNLLPPLPQIRQILLVIILVLHRRRTLLGCSNGRRRGAFERVHLLAGVDPFSVDVNGGS